MHGCTAHTVSYGQASRSPCYAAAQVAAERLSALARTNEAIERDEQLAQVALDSLGDVSPTAGGGSTAGAASTKLFTDADLPSLKMCHRWGCRHLRAAAHRCCGQSCVLDVWCAADQSMCCIVLPLCTQTKWQPDGAWRQHRWSGLRHCT